MMSHVPQSETLIVVLQLPGLEYTLDRLQVLVHWKSLGTEEDTHKPLAKVAKNVPHLFEKLFMRNVAPKYLEIRAHAELAH